MGPELDIGVLFLVYFLVTENSLFQLSVELEVDQCKKSDFPNQAFLPTKKNREF